MDQSPPSRLGEGDPTRSLGSGELPAASGELPTTQPAATRGQRAWRRVLARAVLGRSRRGGVPVLAGPLRRSSGRFAGLGGRSEGVWAQHFSARAGEGRHRGRVSKGCDDGCARGERAAGLRGKFSRSAWRSHVCACEGLDPAGWPRGDAGGWRSRGSSFSTAPSGRRLVSVPRPRTHPPAEGAASSPDPGHQDGLFLAPLPQPPGGSGALHSAPSSLHSASPRVRDPVAQWAGQEP